MVQATRNRAAAHILSDARRVVTDDECDVVLRRDPLHGVHGRDELRLSHHAVAPDRCCKHCTNGVDHNKPESKVKL